MNDQIIKTIQNIENNINNCDILNKLLKDIHNNNGVKDYRYFYDKGYKNSEIELGANLVELYLMLRKYVDQICG